MRPSSSGSARRDGSPSDELLYRLLLGVYLHIAGLDPSFEMHVADQRIQQRTGKVDHWKTSNQKQRWLATALLDLEP